MGETPESIVTWSVADGVAVAEIRYAQQRPLDEFDEVSAALRKIIETDGVNVLVLNLGNIDFMSSRFLGILGALHKRLSAVERKLAVCRMRPEPLRAFRLSRMDRIIPVFASEDEARRSFACSA